MLEVPENREFILEIFFKGYIFRRERDFKDIKQRVPWCGGEKFVNVSFPRMKRERGIFPPFYARYKINHSIVSIIPL